MIQIRPVSDLRNKFTDIENTVSSKNFQEGTYEAFSEPVKFTLQ